MLQVAAAQTTQQAQRAPPADNRNSTVTALFEGPESAGIRIIVHDPTIKPTPSLGLGIAPGVAADVPFSRIERERLYPPFGTCNEAWHADQSGSEPAGYAKSLCERDCYYRSVAEVCDCLLLPWPSSLPARPNQYVCSNAEAACIRTQLTRFQSGELGCGDACPDRCKETVYSTSLGTQTWPS